MSFPKIPANPPAKPSMIVRNIFTMSFPSHPIMIHPWKDVGANPHIKAIKLLR